MKFLFDAAKETIDRAKAFNFSEDAVQFFFDERFYNVITAGRIVASFDIVIFIMTANDRRISVTVA